MSIKKLLVFIALCLGAYQYFYVDKISLLPDSNVVSDRIETRATFSSQKSERTLSSKPTRQQSESKIFRCDGRQYCSQMTSFEEAQFFLRNCPNVKMDGDHDGIPCERQYNSSR